MTQLIYTPDDDVKVHEENAIRLICTPFQSHENGLPEWIKNSADAYARENFPLEKRNILIVFDDAHRKTKASITCIDFVGMTSTDIEKHFRNWADPEAATRGSLSKEVQGGHGNGGKCYMTQMFEDHSYLFTIKSGKKSKYGVAGGSIKFGYIPDRKIGRDLPANSMKKELVDILKIFRLDMESIPPTVIDALNTVDGFTAITGIQPKGYGRKIPVKQLIRNLQEHPQMITTLNYCQIYVYVNGKIQNSGKPLSLPEIKPMHGAEEPRIISIPTRLKDPSTGKKVNTNIGDDKNDGKLIIKTSKKNMRYSLKGRHNIIFRTSSGYIGYTPVTELDIQSAYRVNIYGECHLDSLEPYKQNDRARLAKSPLSRAVERFIANEIQIMAKEFEAQDRRAYDQEEKNELSKMNEALDRWKNRFLDEYMRGLWGSGPGGAPPPAPPLPSGKPVRIDIQMPYKMAGIGVSFRPSIRFFDVNGKHIRPTPYRWISEDTNIAFVDEELRIISTYSIGKTTIYAETLDGKIQSNKITLEVVNIYTITIEPENLELPAGSRRKLNAICELSNSEKSTGVSLVWTESDPNIARVSSSGLVFGFSQGSTSIIAGDDHCISSEPASVEVIASQTGGNGDKKGKGFPVIRVSGDIDKDPDTNDYVYLSKDYPPIYQRVEDVERNIWWINSSSPLARLYLNLEKGYGYQSREWRMYHLERLIDVIVQISLTHDKTDEKIMTVNEWIMKWDGFLKP